MDWQTKGEDKLDNLPSRERFPDHSRDRYRGWNFPYRHMIRWLESKEGQHIDRITHEYVNAQWVPKEFRQAHHLSKYVELNTFMEKGKVCFYDSYCCFVYATHKPYRIVENEASKTFYVHPKSRCLCVHRPKSKKCYYTTYRQEMMEKLKVLGNYHQYGKLNGIWYEFKAEPLPPSALPPWNGERKGPTDILFEKNNAFHNRNSTFPYVKIVLKRQLNHQELMQHGLRNDHIVIDENKRCPKCGGYGMDCIHHRTINWNW